MPKWQVFIVSHSNPTTVTVLELFMGVTNGFGSPFVFGVQNKIREYFDLNRGQYFTLLVTCTTIIFTLPGNNEDDIDFYFVQLVRTTNTNNDFFVYLHFEYFHQIKVLN